MRILISAAETSSDTHGAELLKAIQTQISSKSTVEAFGIGGPKLRAAGLETVVDARELLSIGFSEILGRLPRIFRALDEITQAAIERRPDVAVVIDYPDFHFLLAKRLKKLGIPLVYYIPPKIWVWRKRRAQLLKKLFSKVLCILPFEEDVYKRLQIPATYVGNPLIEELPLSLSRSDARSKLNLGESDLVFLLMPGSRASEFKQHLELMLDSSVWASTRLQELGFLQTPGNSRGGKKLKILMPFPGTADLSPLQARVDQWRRRQKDPSIGIQVSQGNAPECLLAADAGLVKSGTSTLEAGLLQCPHAVVYKPSATTAWIFKNLIRYRGPVGLVNLVAQNKAGDIPLVTEILCENVTSENLGREMVNLVTDSDRLAALKKGFDTLREKLCFAPGSPTPSMRAAHEIINCSRSRREGQRIV